MPIKKWKTLFLRRITLPHAASDRQMALSSVHSLTGFGRLEPVDRMAVARRRVSDPKPPNSRRAIRLWHSCVDAYISNP
jgi:hypothetical protein